jgi:hypothetical protein
MTKSTKRRLGIAVLLGAAAFGAYRAVGLWFKVADDPALLLDRAWIDSKPVKYTDYVQAFFVSSHSPVSVFQKASAYDLHFELANYRRDKGKLSLTFPQTGKTAEFTYTVKACSDLPPFDLCLDLSDNPWGGPKRYYGMKEQEDEAKHAGRVARSLKSLALR